MTPERLASMTQFAISFDWETHLIQPGLVCPPPVLASAAEPEPIGLDAGIARPGEPIVKINLRASLLSKADGRRLFRAVLDDSRYVLCVANGPFDFLVSAVDAYATTGEDLMPKLFAMYDPRGTIVRGHCDGRVFDVQLAEGLHGIAQGHHGKQWRNDKLQLGKSGRYSLDAVTYEVTGRQDAKANDRFRLNYALFDDQPLEALPYEAQIYPQDDAKNTLEAALGQAGHVPSAHPHNWVTHPQIANAMYCTQCGKPFTLDAPFDCMVKKPRRNLHDLARQTYAHWALHLGAAWGFNVDQTAVDALEKKIDDAREADAAPFVAAGIVRENGTENQAVLKRLVAIAYGSRNPCRACEATVDKYGTPLPGKVPNVTPKGVHNFVNCEACDGTALELTDSVPRSGGGGVAKGRDDLTESGDELLTAYGEQEGKKIKSTYIPLMRGGRACNVCGEKGVATKYTAAHKEWCTAQNGEAGYRPIPLILRPNPLVETGRCSYGDGIHGLPRKGGVRECFVARPGYVFSSEDYTGGELVTHAWNCLKIIGYSKLAEALNAGLDAHLALAGTMLGKSYAEMVALKERGDAIVANNRQAAKKGNFGFGGGMAELTFTLRNRADPDIFTPCVNGPHFDDDGNPGYRGMRPCILMDGYDRCGYVKVTTYNDNPCPPVCLKCVEASKRLREFWFQQWPENNQKDGYFRHIKIEIAQPGPSGTPEIVHMQSKRVRGGVGFCDGANGLFQGLLADAMKDAFCQIQRECFDRTWRVRSSEMMQSKYDGADSPLYGSRAIILAHDETMAEHPESAAHEAAHRVSEIMVESLRFKCPELAPAVKAEPTLMRRLYKGAAPVFKDGRLVPWEPKRKS